MKFDEAAFTAKGIVWTRSGNLMRFMVPGESAVVDVNIEEDGTLRLVPKQSHKHRALIAAMGRADADE